MRTRIGLTCGAIFVAALPALAGGGCAEVAGNVLAKKDCSFAAGVAGWETVRGSASHRGTDGGALAGTVDGQGSLTLQGPCVAVEAGRDYRFAVRLRALEGNGYFFAMNVLEFTDAACDESTGILSMTGAPPTASWADLETTETISDGTRAVRLELNGSGESGTTVLFDDLVIARP